MDKIRFGQFIKDARLTKGLTQAEVADRLYVDVTAVSKWERGINFPDISLISDLCKVLDVTEHELIESSKDTEYRQMMFNANQYQKSKKIAFWIVTGCFLLALLTCFVVNLSVRHTLSWFFIVLMGCACGYWGIMYPILFKIIKKRISEEAASVLSRFAFLIYSAGLLVWTIAILLTTHANYPMDIGFALKVTIYCFIILILYGVVEIPRIGRLCKLGVDLLLTGLFAVSLAKVLPWLMHVKEENYFDIDFSNWAEHSNGNVALIILLSFGVLGITLIILGILRKMRQKEKT